MRAAICDAFGERLSIEDIQLDPPEAGEIEVEVAACAICHSDLLYANGSWAVPLPAVFGHEVSGIVRGIGPGVKDFAPGDRVVVTLIRACGTCPACAQSHRVTCETAFPRAAKSPLRRQNGERLFQGLRTGGFAERVVVDASQAVVVSSAIGFVPASLLACGVITGHGAVVNTARLRGGENVVVIGAGGVGLNVIQAAAIAGAGRIIAVDVVAAKLEIARQFGATHALHGGEATLMQMVRDLSGGRGADVVFVTVGASRAFVQGFDLVARSGTVVLVGIPPDGVMLGIEAGRIAQDNIRVLGSKMGDSNIRTDIPILVEHYAAGRLKLDELATACFQLEEINEAIAAIASGEAIRNVILMK
jgi:S-(hydroxymethyl)glutathione dehydrogenase/alcohol dehydrogenase